MMTIRREIAKKRSRLNFGKSENRLGMVLKKMNLYLAFLSNTGPRTVKKLFWLTEELSGINSSKSLSTES